MKTKQGDLIGMALAGEFDVIVHGCNCYCTMGKGIALSIKRVFPEAYAADCQTTKGDVNKLGSITFTAVKRMGLNITVVNAYTQFDYMYGGRNADYDAIRLAMKEVKRLFSGKRIGYPKIGAGLAGGNWGIIYPIIQQELSGEDHTLVIYKP